MGDFSHRGSHDWLIYHDSSRSFNGTDDMGIEIVEPFEVHFTKRNRIDFNLRSTYIAEQQDD